MTKYKTLQDLSDKVVTCHRCPRLVEFRETVNIRASLLQKEPWRRPVPGFGDNEAKLMIVGLAPSATGANRTGRMFTGDESARFLIHALHQAGFANQSTSLEREDGLQLKGCYMTAAVKCVPPLNRPLPEEFVNCSGYLENELALLPQLKVVLGLGKLAFDAYQKYLMRQKVLKKMVSFSHGASLAIPGHPILYGSYHPSPQNTYTGKLTEKMMVKLLRQIHLEI